jgi:hypothetical protein
MKSTKGIRILTYADEYMLAGLHCLRLNNEML